MVVLLLTRVGEEAHRGDTVVGWDAVEKTQNDLYGHASMIYKIYGIVKAWDHTSRVTVMGEALATYPSQLLYKDHMGWTRDSGKCLPTKSVAEFVPVRSHLRLG